MSDADTPQEGRMTLMEHLGELRTRIVRSAIAVLVGGVVGWIMYGPILDVLLRPYCQLDQGGRAVAGLTDECLLFVRDPIETLQIRLQISLYAGLALAMPIVLWQLWRFVTPGLYDNERHYAAPFVAVSASLFFLGAGLAYWTMPKALGFFEAIGGNNLVALYSPAPYLKLITFMMLAFGLGFEFPILLVFLQMAGIVKPSTLAGYRRYALVGIVTLVAVITPSGDPISLIALSGPMYLFYEFAILWGRRNERRRDERQPEEA